MHRLTLESDSRALRWVWQEGRVSAAHHCRLQVRVLGKGVPAAEHGCEALARMVELASQLSPAQAPHMRLLLAIKADPNITDLEVSF